MIVRATILVCILSVISLNCWSQKKRVTHSGSKHNRSGFNGSKSKGKKIACPIFEDSQYPYHGLGFKLGDPFAFTYKFYPSKKFAFAADLGKAASGLYNRYFREKFSEYQNFDTLTNNSFVRYLSHRVKGDFIGEIKALYHIDGKGISPGLQFYIGAGWEWKNTRLSYDYLYEGGAAGSETLPGNYQVYRGTQGPQGVLGIEYSYFKLPISAFMELEYFADVQADPGWRNVEGGVGLRYIF
ncbi:hypothetical protein [Pseudochryseolinea flava]|uniref:Outer membrane protein beta-barrel domain-containing protein n=1 Tax=Pseudochryseolinea flava TaxID=2059302 RepID=A0A364Y7K4_9BACT|nr:hypothetical protein [Pseudochryseolinea flava]RAW03051.1 hypothetical protein DQQ10_02840 [Pseudochryseolinea flava]